MIEQAGSDPHRAIAVENTSSAKLSDLVKNPPISANSRESENTSS
jgi:hypothetical protein